VNGYRLGLLHGALLAQVSVSVFGLSKHSEPGYCEVNPGLGINYQISENVRFGHGRYQNSKCSYTNITGLVYCPVKIGGFCFGMAFVRLTGYGPRRSTRRFQSGPTRSTSTTPSTSSR
jgi:hypothetical protein